MSSTRISESSFIPVPRWSDPVDRRLVWFVQARHRRQHVGILAGWRIAAGRRIEQEIDVLRIEAEADEDDLLRACSSRMQRRYIFPVGQPLGGRADLVGQVVDVPWLLFAPFHVRRFARLPRQAPGIAIGMDYIEPGADQRPRLVQGHAECHVHHERKVVLDRTVAIEADDGQVVETLFRPVARDARSDQAAKLEQPVLGSAQRQVGRVARHPAERAARLGLERIVHDRQLARGHRQRIVTELLEDRIDRASHPRRSADRLPCLLQLGIGRIDAAGELLEMVGQHLHVARLPLGPEPRKVEPLRHPVQHFARVGQLDFAARARPDDQGGLAPDHRRKGLRALLLRKNP